MCPARWRPGAGGLGLEWGCSPGSPGPVSPRSPFLRRGETWQESPTGKWGAFAPREVLPMGPRGTGQSGPTGCFVPVGTAGTG